MGSEYPRIRYNPLIPSRVTIISTVRGKRPKILKAMDVEVSRNTTCPFCPGNEGLTPPATLVLRKVGKDLIFDREEGDVRFSDWIVRIIPNKYPAYIHDRSINELKDLAFGYHEVIVECRDHGKQPPTMSVNELVLMFRTLFKRVKEILSNELIRYLIIIRNYGSRAGASIPHPHMQLFASHSLIPIIELEARTFEDLRNTLGTCPLCQELKRAEEGGRVVYSNELFKVFTPWAPRQPYELWMAPIRHEESPLNYGDDELKLLADAFKKALSLYRSCLNDPAYNLWFHITPKRLLGTDTFHWHIEIEPVIATWGGLERGGGAYIVTVSPEASAKEFSNCVRRPYKHKYKTN